MWGVSQPWCLLTSCALTFWGCDDVVSAFGRVSLQNIRRREHISSRICFKVLVLVSMLFTWPWTEKNTNDMKMQPDVKGEDFRDIFIQHLYTMWLDMEGNQCRHEENMQTKLRKAMPLCCPTSKSMQFESSCFWISSILTHLMQVDLHAGLQSCLHLTDQHFTLHELLLQGAEVVPVAHHITSCPAGARASRDFTLTTPCARGSIHLFTTSLNKLSHQQHYHNMRQISRTIQDLTDLQCWTPESY